ncbi:hypothetical protein DITRI_Ditri03aG0199000 [Diplodiscus trichospermus]
MFIGFILGAELSVQYSVDAIGVFAYLMSDSVGEMIDIQSCRAIRLRLHEAVPGKRYNRYVELAQAAFVVTLFCYGTDADFQLHKSLIFCPCVTSRKMGTKRKIGSLTCSFSNSLFISRNCNSFDSHRREDHEIILPDCLQASLFVKSSDNVRVVFGAVTAITYSTMVWLLSVSQQRPPTISYEPLSLPPSAATFFSVMNALGIVAFSFRCHNLVLEIQATMPSTIKQPAHVPMWRGAKVAYFFIAMCLFPIAIGGFWAYGNVMPSGGILNALFAFHSHDIPRGLLALTFLLVVFNCLSSFQIHSMPVSDSFEAGYTRVALPFLSSLAGLLGGLTLPVTYAYPCFMDGLAHLKIPESGYLKHSLLKTPNHNLSYVRAFTSGDGMAFPVPPQMSLVLLNGAIYN